VTETDPQLRRRPTQRRGAQRIERILDVADRLLAAEGAGALTMSALAARAEISVGSLYHWFPDRASVVRALALRYWHELADLIDALVEAADAGLIDDPLPRAIDTLAAGFRARPGFLALWYSELRTEALRDATRPVRDRVAAALVRLLAVEHPDADPGLCATVAQTLTVLGDGLLREAFRVDRQGDAGLLAEGRLALGAYVARRLGGEG
jgi:AcrR family transcriptional regulator